MKLGQASALTIAVVCVLVSGGCGGDQERSFAGTPNFTANPPPGWASWNEAEREQLGKASDALLQELDEVPEEAKLDFQVLAVWSEPPRGQRLPAEIIVIKEFLPPEMSEQEYLRTTEEVLAVLDATEIQSGTGPRVGGDPSRFFEYEVQLAPGVNARERDVLVFRDGGAYAISLTATPKRFENSVRHLDRIVESWRWTD